MQDLAFFKIKFLYTSIFTVNIDTDHDMPYKISMEHIFHATDTII